MTRIALATPFSYAQSVFLGTFLPDPTAVPRVVIAHLAEQLDNAEPSCLFAKGAVTQHAHTTEIQRRLGYRDFCQQPEHFRLVRWLYTRASVSAERPIELFELTSPEQSSRFAVALGVEIGAQHR